NVQQQGVYSFLFLLPQQASNADKSNNTTITNSIDEVQSTFTLLMHSNTDEIQLMSTQSMHSNADDIMKIANSNENNDNELTQLFEEYKAVLLDALKIVQEQKMLIIYNGHDLFKEEDNAKTTTNLLTQQKVFSNNPRSLLN
ncbi:27880_t:CDS:2, partial [Gigaspora margarita]